MVSVKSQNIILKKGRIRNKTSITSHKVIETMGKNNNNTIKQITIQRLIKRLKRNQLENSPKTSVMWETINYMKGQSS